MTIRAIALAVLAAGTFWCLSGCAENLSAEHEEAASLRSPITGSPAPDFTLADQNKQMVTLSKLRGKWVVLYFYPKDDTPGCTCEATEFTKLMGQFRDMNAEVYGVSADSPVTHQAFIELYDLSLNLLSDRDRKVMKEYGAWVQAGIGEKKYGRTIRSTVIIGPDGTIRRHWPEVIPQGHAGRVKEKLAQLQAVLQ